MIDIQNCSKKFGSVEAVNNISFTVGPGEIAGLLGPNGAGKSTTIKMMVGLLRPDAGVIRIGGFDITRDAVDAKRILAYVPEKAFIYEKLTAGEYLSFVRGLYGLEDAVFENRADEFLGIFGLTGWKNELIGNFSMGMKQRLLLTSVFMRDPKLIVLDEPHNGLDPKGVRILKDILFGVRDQGTAVVLSTHIIAIAEQICDSISIINRGMVVAQGTKDDLKHYAKSTDRNLEDIFLRLTSDYA